MDLIAKEEAKNSTKIYYCLVTAIANDKCTVILNNKEYTLPFYGGVPYPNKIYITVLPQNNINKAFVIGENKAIYVTDVNISPHNTGQLTFYRYDSNTLNTPYTQGITGFASGIIICFELNTMCTQFAIPAGGILLFSRRLYNNSWTAWGRFYDTNNPPPYPVTSVNNKTGDVILAASDVGAVSKTGDTMSGNLDVIKNIQEGTAVTVENTYHNHKVGTLIGISTGNGGLYDYTNQKWIVYSTPSGDIKYNGIIPIANGGTNATTASDACANLGAVKTSGDNMTGVLKFGNSGSYAQRNLPVLTIGNSYILFAAIDSDGYDRGGLSIQRSNANGDGIWLNHRKNIGGTTYYNRIALFVNDSGDPVVEVNSTKAKKAWQQGLDLCYSAGDSITFGTSGSNVYNRFAGDWRSTTHLWFTIPLAKICEGLTATLSGSVMVCSNGTRNTVNMSNVTATCYTTPCGVTVDLGFSSAPSYAVAYMPVTVQSYGLTLTFS